MAGHWKVGQVKITGTKVSPFLFFLARAEEISLGERMRRHPNVYPASIRVMATMVRSTWSENLKENTQLQPGFHGRPAMRSVGVCWSEGLKRPACLFTWTIFFSC